MKKLLSILTAVLILTSVLCLPANAASEVQTTPDGLYEYRLTNNGKNAELVSYKGEKLEGESYSVPETLNGVTVTSIGSRAFMNEKSDYHASLLWTERLVIPDTVTYIGEEAFAFSRIKDVSLPDSVVYIDDYAFAYSSLEQVVIPDSVRKLGKCSFAFIYNLKTITLGSGIKEIPVQCFRDLYNLKTVNNSVQVSYIGDYAFFNCSNFTELHVNESVGFGKYFFGYIEDPDWGGEEDFDYGEYLHPALLAPERYKIVAEQKRTDRYISGYDGVMAYAYKTGIPAELSIRSDLISEEQERSFSCGQSFRLLLDGKQVSGWKSTNKKALKISDKGNVQIRTYTGEKNAVTVKTEDGKTIKVKLINYIHPALYRAYLHGGSEPKADTEYVRSITLKKGKAVDLIISGRVKSVSNKYISKKNAKIIAEPKSDLIRVYGAAKGKATLGVVVNGCKIKLKVIVK